MLNIKLREATKKLGMTNKLAMFFLEKKGLPVKSHSSAISMEQLELLRDFVDYKEKYSDIVSMFKKIESEKKSKKTELKEQPKIKEDVKKNKEEVPKEKPIKEEKKDIPQKSKIEKPKKIVEEKKDNITVKNKNLKGKAPISKNKEEKSKRKSYKKKPLVSTKPRKKVDLGDLPELIQVPDVLTSKELAEKLNIKMKNFEDKLRELNLSYAANDNLEISDIKLLCDSYEVEVDIIGFEDYVFACDIESKKARLEGISPVVTVMGHVDHGKTTLLDKLRNSRVADGEAGGITQSIGAYTIYTQSGPITFVDTPGHEAFSNLRARGAQVTDIVVLIVAANDGVKPQTIEAIDHARAAKVPIIVAINKIDMPNADPNKTKQELSRHGIVIEEWGGDVVCVEISAKKGTNIESLLEMINITAEMLELKAYLGIKGRGTVIESRLDGKLGPVATIVVQNGTVKRGDYFIVGNSVGKVKGIFDDTRRNTLKEAEATIAIEIMGFSEVPNAGDCFQVVKNLDKAKKVIIARQHQHKSSKNESFADSKLNPLDLINKKIELQNQKTFPVIIKADNYGSTEVLNNVLEKQSVEKVKVEIIHKGVGNINESDILLATTSGAIVIGFNVKAPQKIIALAKKEGVTIKLFNVIYHLIEEVQKSIRGEITPEYIESKIGEAEVLQKFKISKIGIIAGCRVREGKVTRKSKIKILRDSDLVFEGEVETLRRHKDEVTEVKAGIECGIRVKNFNDIEVNDKLDIYELIEKKI